MYIERKKQYNPLDAQHRQRFWFHTSKYYRLWHQYCMSRECIPSYYTIFATCHIATVKILICKVISNFKHTHSIINKRDTWSVNVYNNHSHCLYALRCERFPHTQQQYANKQNAAVVLQPLRTCLPQNRRREKHASACVCMCVCARMCAGKSIAPLFSLIP